MQGLQYLASKMCSGQGEAGKATTFSGKIWHTKQYLGGQQNGAPHCAKTQSKCSEMMH